MIRPHPYAVLSLILGVTVAPPAFAQPVFESEGANRDSFYSGRVIYGSNRVHDADHGVWQLDAPLYESVYRPQVTYCLRMDNATRTRVVAAQLTWMSVPPGASCPWDDEPGSTWLTSNLAATFNPETMRWAEASAGGEPVHARGTHAPRLIDGEWVIPLTMRIDQSDRYWDWLGRPEPWEWHDAWFARLPVWLEQPDTDHATARVRLHATTADFSLDIHAEPPSHTDLDRDGAVVAPDIFRFLSEWFGGFAAGDWNADGILAVPDISAYLAEWFEERE